MFTIALSKLYEELHRNIGKHIRRDLVIDISDLKDRFLGTRFLIEAEIFRPSVTLRMTCFLISPMLLQTVIEILITIELFLDFLERMITRNIIFERDLIFLIAVLIDVMGESVLINVIRFFRVEPSVIVLRTEDSSLARTTVMAC